MVRGVGKVRVGKGVNLIVLYLILWVIWDFYVCRFVEFYEVEVKVNKFVVIVEGNLEFWEDVDVW